MTRIALFLLLLSAFGLPTIAQEFAISADWQNILFVGLPNQITIAVNDCKCKDMQVETTNGYITPTDKPCVYLVFPAEVGKSVLTLYRKADHQKIGSSEYRNKMREIIVRFGGYRFFELANIEQSRGMYIDISGGADVQSPIEEGTFFLTATRGDKILFARRSNTLELDDEMKKLLKTLEPGDTLQLTEIQCSWPDGKTRNIPSATIIVK